MDAREFRTRLKRDIDELIDTETSHLLDQVEADFKEHRGAGTFARLCRLKGLREAAGMADEIVKEIYDQPTGKA